MTASRKLADDCAREPGYHLAISLPPWGCHETAARPLRGLRQSGRGFVEPHNLERGKALDVSVVEVLGQNIEFAVLQDGRQVFTSGVHSGRATGRVACLPGVVTVSVTNGNIMESKTVRVTVLASSL